VLFRSLATTTSTDDTGLLDFLAPTILKATGVEMRWTSTGTGKALELGKNCDADLVLVHAPKAEQAFVEQGHGVKRRLVMFNDFVLIGPRTTRRGSRAWALPPPWPSCPRSRRSSSAGATSPART
jgi:tungstate transport system substrate-binding protein